MSDRPIAWDTPQVLSVPHDGLIFVPRYKKNQLWVERLKPSPRGGMVHDDWERRANRPAEYDGLDLHDPIRRLARRNPNDVAAFHPAAREIRRLMSWPESRLIMIDNGAPNEYDEGDDASDDVMRDQVMDKLAELRRDLTAPLSMIIHVCHGFNTGIQFGFSIRNETERNRTRAWLQAIAEISRHDLSMPIYGCSTAGGANDGADGFANFIRTTLVSMGITYCRVDGHTIAGHATRLSLVRRFEGTETGGWLVDPDDATLYPVWRRALRDDSSDLKYRYPLMTKSAIHAELRGRENSGR